MTRLETLPALLIRARIQHLRTGDPALAWAVSALESLVEPEHRELDGWVLRAAASLVEEAEEEEPRARLAG